MTALAGTLERAGFATFLPHRDGLERYVMPYVDSPLNTRLFGLRARIDRAIFAVDVYQIVRRCDCLVFNLNGRVTDEGAAVEAGIAFAAGTPVVLYKNDRRSVFQGGDNSMLRGLSSMKPIEALDALPAALERITIPVAAGRERPLPPSLQAAVEEGEKLWRLMRPPAGSPPKPLAADALASALLAAIEKSAPTDG